MDILERIVAYKHIEVGGRKQLVSTKSLERSRYFNRPTLSLKASLLNPQKSGIIAEFKRHSPSKKDINIMAKVADVTTGYTQAGVSGISCLTDTKFFKGTNEDLKIARQHNPQTPILRKEFIVDEYQLIEAKSIGADVILLIAECLNKSGFHLHCQIVNSNKLTITRMNFGPRPLHMKTVFNVNVTFFGIQHIIDVRANNECV